VSRESRKGERRTWMEGVGHRRVVNNDALRDISVEEGQIFDIMAFMIHTALTEQTIVDDIVDIQLVQERISILAE
jgi:hypothetical protein